MTSKNECVICFLFHRYSSPVYMSITSDLMYRLWWFRFFPFSYNNKKKKVYVWLNWQEMLNASGFCFIDKAKSQKHLINKSTSFVLFCMCYLQHDVNDNGLKIERMVSWICKWMMKSTASLLCCRLIYIYLSGWCKKEKSLTSYIQ
jgi:hypothetical protein